MLKRKFHAQAGISMVELMVGIAVGLIVLTGATKLFVDTIDTNRRQLLTTRLNQELRTVTDLLARDLRRAGYWGNSTAGIASGSNPGADNSYAAISITDNGVSDTITFRYATDTDDAVADAETYVIRLQSGVIQMSKDNGTTWFDLTDASATTISAFSITPTTRTVSLQEYCFTGGTPNLNIREYNILVAGRAAADSTISRQIRESVRVRADQISGTC